MCRFLIGVGGKESESSAVGRENGGWTVTGIQLCVGANFCSETHGLRLVRSSQDEADGEAEGD